jgi:hypothetical protein
MYLAQRGSFANKCCGNAGSHDLDDVLAAAGVAECEQAMHAADAQASIDSMAALSALSRGEAGNAALAAELQACIASAEATAANVAALHAAIVRACVTAFCALWQHGAAAHMNPVDAFLAAHGAAVQGAAARCLAAYGRERAPAAAVGEGRLRPMLRCASFNGTDIGTRASVMAPVLPGSPNGSCPAERMVQPACLQRECQGQALGEASGWEGAEWDSDGSWGAPPPPQLAPTPAPQPAPQPPPPATAPGAAVPASAEAPSTAEPAAESPPGAGVSSGLKKVTQQGSGSVSGATSPKKKKVVRKVIKKVVRRKAGTDAIAGVSASSSTLPASAAASTEAEAALPHADRVDPQSTSVAAGAQDFERTNAAEPEPHEPREPDHVVPASIRSLTDAAPDNRQASVTQPAEQERETAGETARTAESAVAGSVQDRRNHAADGGHPGAPALAETAFQPVAPLPTEAGVEEGGQAAVGAAAADKPDDAWDSDWDDEPAAAEPAVAAPSEPARPAPAEAAAAGHGDEADAHAAQNRGAAAGWVDDWDDEGGGEWTAAPPAAAASTVQAQSASAEERTARALLRAAQQTTSTAAGGGGLVAALVQSALDGTPPPVQLTEHGGAMQNLFASGFGALGLRNATPYMADFATVVILVVGGITGQEVGEAEAACHASRAARALGADVPDVYVGGTSLLSSSEFARALVPDLSVV